MQFWKTEKTCWRYHHFTHVYQKTTIIWGTAPEIQSETDMIFYHFGGFFALLLPNKPKNQNFKQMKKSSGDVIILHMCSKNHDHMMYASWDMECDRHNFLPGDIIILHSCTINEDHMMHCSWDIKARRTESIFWKNEEYAWRYYYFTLVYYKWRLYDVWFLRYGAWWIYYFVIFHFGVLLPPPPQKKENEKKRREISSCDVYQKLWSDNVWFLRYGARRTDGWMDGRKNWHKNTDINFIDIIILNNIKFSNVKISTSR